MDLSSNNQLIRPRTTTRKYKSLKALEALRRLYESTPYPNRFELGSVARSNNLDIESVRVWFQSRRQRDWRKGKLCRTCRYFKSPGVSEELHESNPYSRPCLHYSTVLSNGPPPAHHRLPLQTIAYPTYGGNNPYAASGSFSTSYPEPYQPMMQPNPPPMYHAWQMETKENVNHSQWPPASYGFNNNQWIQNGCPPNYNPPLNNSNNNFLPTLPLQPTQNVGCQVTSQSAFNFSTQPLPSLFQWAAINAASMLYQQQQQPSYQQDDDSDYSQTAESTSYGFDCLTSSDEEEYVCNY